jgi:hypothetical protein
MKRLTILWIISCVGLLVLPAAAIGAPAGPPGGLDVAVINTPLPVTGSVEATVTGDVNVTNLPAVQEVTGRVEVTETVEAVVLDGRVCVDSEKHNVNLHFSIPEDMVLILEDVTLSVLRCGGSGGTPITPNQLTATVGGAVLGQFNDAVVGSDEFSGRTFNKQVKLNSVGGLSVNVKIDPPDFVSGVFFLGHGRLVPGSQTTIHDN